MPPREERPEDEGLPQVIYRVVYTDCTKLQVAGEIVALTGGLFGIFQGAMWLIERLS